MDIWSTFILFIVIIPSSLPGRPNQMNPYGSNSPAAPVILEIPDDTERSEPKIRSISSLPQSSTSSSVQTQTTENVGTSEVPVTQPPTSTPKTTLSSSSTTTLPPETNTNRVSTLKPKPGPYQPSLKPPIFPPHAKTVQRKPALNEDDELSFILDQNYELDALQPKPRMMRIPPIDIPYFASPMVNLGYFDHKSTPGPLIRPYGKCRVGDFPNNKISCQEGETCYPFKEFDTPEECEAGTPSTKCKGCDPPCTPSSPGTPGSCGSLPACPSGCELPEPWTPISPSDPGKCDMSQVELDGFCADATFGTDQYVDATESTTAEQTPMVFYGGSLVKDESCTVYGDAVDLIQKSNKEFNDKLQAFRQEAQANFGSLICNWNIARLECIPNSHDNPTLPPAGGGGGGGGPPAPPGPGGGTPDGGGYTNDLWDIYRRRQGSCQCLLGLGRKALYLLDENSNEYDPKPKCYIPAGKGHDSNCAHDVLLPHGLMDYLNLKEMSKHERLIVGRAFDMCVPNAECKPGYKYVGVRCSCKKGYKLDPLNGTCADATRLKIGRSNWELYAVSLVIIPGWIYIQKYFHFY
ncbi:unnamed protein product [Orchesella dallaii]|uniref:Uncharacterized protein n=1 Tax=Orchesella dallaii TaxID=48710 RepID=A0ABP1PWK6_9HEXA